MKRHPDLYFDDGDLILLAEETCFRVHSSNLSRHSAVFREMLTFPQPQDQYMIDGCPVVPLHDPMLDVGHFLTAVYDGLYFSNSDSTSFVCLSAILRLSHKYISGCLWRRSLFRFQLDWPLTLEEWDARELMATTSDGSYDLSTARTHPILIVNLARKLDLPRLLPTAFYDLSRTFPSQVLCGSPDIGGSAEAYLDEFDLKMVFQGRELGEKFMASFISKELEDRGTASWCHNVPDNYGFMCREAFMLIQREVLQITEDLRAGGESDPLFTLQCLLDVIELEATSELAVMITERLCNLCRAELRKATEEARSKLWEALPEWFTFDQGTLVKEEETHCQHT